MKRALAVLSLIAAGVAGCLFYGRNTSLGRQADITHRAPARTNTVTLDVANQRKCGEQAHEEFWRAGWDRNRLAKFVAHYSEALKTCFIEFDLIIANADGADVMRSLSDAEGREYATYAQAASRDGKQSEASPTVCEVALPSGEQIECSSLEQFNEYIKGYMVDSQDDVMRADGSGAARPPERFSPLLSAR